MFEIDVSIVFLRNLKRTVSSLLIVNVIDVDFGRLRETWGE